MSTASIQLRDPTADAALGSLIRESRQLIGWTQRELAHHAGTSQSTVSRIEAGQAGTTDLATIGHLLVALGLRPSIELDLRHLGDRRRQADAVHAVVNGFGARKLERWSWLTATEVRLGDGVPIGWVDLMAFRPADRALVVDETKTEIHDVGGMQRSIAFYHREAWAAAAALGWVPSRVEVLVLALDSTAVARQLAANRDLVTRAFPGDVDRMAAWLQYPDAPPPNGWTLATCDPATRSPDWLRPTTLTGRPTAPRYADYADAARRLLGRR
jgi:transcriptional regulator with XRE-family HTH domain